MIIRVGLIGMGCEPHVSELSVSQMYNCFRSLLVMFLDLKLWSPMVLDSRLWRYLIVLVFKAAMDSGRRNYSGIDDLIPGLLMIFIIILEFS